MRQIFLLIAVFFPSFLFAEGSTSSAVSTSSALAETPTSFKEPFSGEALTQLAVGMVVVIAVILILSWALKEGELELGDVKNESFSQRLAEVVKQRQNKPDGKIDE